MKKASKKPEKGGIQSLERAFAILEEVARKQDGINLVDLSKAVGLHNSTTFHLVKTMVQLGYISQMRESKRYRIGSRLFTLAAGALEENSYLEIATPVLEKLTRETGESAHFAIRSANEIVVIARTAATGMLQLAVRAGAARPAHATALGKVLLAALPPQDLAQFLAGVEMRRYTPKTIVGREAFLRELEDVRKKGIAFDDGEFDAEMRCVAVPVYDFAGRVAGAIGISGPIWRLSLQALQDKAKLARVSAAELSTGLGFQKRSEPAVRSA
jgi:DNA-binding IclR family transcriptional regulator